MIVKKNKNNFGDKKLPQHQYTPTDRYFHPEFLFCGKERGSPLISATQPDGRYKASDFEIDGKGWVSW